MNAPTSTYRLQLHAGFTMDDAAAVVPYLRGLGVGCVYLSPILQAAAGSTHGYDTVDPTRIDADRGGRPAFDRLLATCVEHTMGVVLDIVPNHMCVTSPDNPWWRSVLTFGPASPQAGWFDIDWESPHSDGRAILPVLGEPLDDAIHAGAITLRCVGGELRLAYHEHHWPLRPATAAGVLRSLDPGAAAPLTDLATRLQAVNVATDDRPGDASLEADLDAIRTELAARLEKNPGLRRDLDDGLAELAEPSGLTGVIDAQHYRLAFWRDGGRVVNYRRFFDIDSLAAVRAERPEVFDAVSALILELAGLPGVVGLRVDHPDGLRDPKAYFGRLAEHAPGTWIVAEKILESHEPLPGDWAVAGTTGYDFLNDATRLLIDPASEEQLTRIYEGFTGRSEPFHAVTLRSKREAAERLLAADLDRVVRLVAAAMPESHAADSAGIRGAVAALAAGLPVYRTYLTEGRPSPTDAERGFWATALERATDRATDEQRRLIKSVARVLSDPGPNDAAREAAIRFQQFSAPATAKGVEDTAFYRSVRFPALNEVGGDPALWSLDAGAFHERVLARAHNWPDAMLAASTHDTKRSEDVRARLCVLTEMPDRWADRLDAWRQDAAEHGVNEIDAKDLYLLLHSIVGAWPIDAARAQAYMQKATREAKERTSWRDPDEAYERSLSDLIARLLADNAFAGSVAAFVDEIRRPGRVKSLTQTALRLACPGVPDVYQGNELWDLSLVDPDNRRPIDYALRTATLKDLDRTEPRDLWASLDDPDDPGRTKLWLTRVLLGLRRAYPGVFGGAGRYEPIAPSGPGADRVIAFARGASDRDPLAFAVVLPLRTLDAAPPDASIDLPAPDGGGDWINLADGASVPPGSIPLAGLFATAPLALLAGKECTP